MLSNVDYVSVWYRPLAREADQWAPLIMQLYSCFSTIIMGAGRQNQNERVYYSQSGTEDKTERWGTLNDSRLVQDDSLRQRWFEDRSLPKNENSVIIYLLSCHSNPRRLSVNLRNTNILLLFTHHFVQILKVNVIVMFKKDIAKEIHMNCAVFH